MPQQLKSLLQQLYPLSFTKTPQSASKKCSIKLSTPRSTPIGTPQTNNSSKLSFESSVNSKILTPRLKLRVSDTDSGVDTMSCNYIVRNACECNRCTTRNNTRNQIENTLKHAFVNYLREPSEKNFANLPIMIAKSFKPSAAKNTRQLDQIEVRKNNAVNVLFMKDNKWVYVKTSSNVKGFIPKKCLEPFVVKSCPEKRKVSTSSPKPKTPKSMVPTKPANHNADHTYMTINDNDLKEHPKSKCMDITNYSDNTDINLLSVSNYVETPKSTKFSKNLMKKFIECDRKEVRVSSEYIRILSKSKSRNRKLAIAFRQLSNEASLTMLEQDASKNYINLNDCKADSNQYENCIGYPHSNIRKRNDFNYENLAAYKSIKRSKKKSNYSYLCSSPSSIEYDELNIETKPSTPSNHYSNDYMTFLDSYSSDSEEHIYDHLSSNNSKVLNMFKIVDDYTADFKGDLSVNKGDIVYLIDTAVSPSMVKNNDYLFVRIYKRKLRASPNSQLEGQILKGYIPRSCAVKMQ